MLKRISLLLLLTFMIKPGLEKTAEINNLNNTIIRLSTSITKLENIKTDTETKKQIEVALNVLKSLLLANKKYLDKLFAQQQAKAQ